VAAGAFAKKLHANGTRRVAPDIGMSEEHILRYTDLAAVIQMARARGWPNVRIVRVMSSGLAYPEVLKLARKAAPLLDISVSEFLRLLKDD
jgi:hypothetical protein